MECRAQSPANSHIQTTNQLPGAVLLFHFKSAGNWPLLLQFWVSTFWKTCQLEATCTQAQRNVIIGCLVAFVLLYFLVMSTPRNFLKKWPIKGFYDIAALLNMAWLWWFVGRKRWVYWHSFSSFHFHSGVNVMKFSTLPRHCLPRLGDGKWNLTFFTLKLLFNIP